MSNDTAFPSMMVVWTQNRICRRNLPFDRSMNIFYLVLNVSRHGLYADKMIR